MVCHEVTMWQAFTGVRVLYLQSTEALTDASSQPSFAGDGALPECRPARKKPIAPAARERELADDARPGSRHETARVPARPAQPRRAPRCAARHRPCRQYHARALEDCRADR